LQLEALEERRVLAQTVGVFTNDESATYNGYTLFGPSMSTDTFLIDMQGREVNTWHSQYPPMSQYLLEDGDMIRMARMPQQNFPAGGAAGRLERFDWDGNLVWSYELNTPNRLLHHDFEVMPNGNILVIAWEKKSADVAIANGRNPALLPQNEIWPDSILEIQPTGSSGGNIVWEWHLWDHLVQNFDSSKQNYGSVAAHPELVNLNYTPSGEGKGDFIADWTHFNAIDYNAQLDQIMISTREFSEVWIIDHSTTTAQAAGHRGGNSGMGGDILYRYGNPAAYDRGTRQDQKLFFQHDAQWIKPGLPGAGDIMVFNNGWNRVDGSDYSSVVEFTPPMAHQWYLNDRTDGSTTNLTVFDTGTVPDGWIPLTGDWNGDGRDTGGFYDPVNKRFIFNNQTNGSTDNVVTVQLSGLGANWQPIIGDWDGDGDDTFGFYDPDSETWRLYADLSASTQGLITFQTPTVPGNWIALAGDWNHDTRDSVGLYDPDGHTFWLNNNVDGSTTNLIKFVTPPVPANWKPIAGDWNNDGFDTVGLYDAANYRWFLNNRVDGSINDMITVVTPPVPANWRPIVGDWDADGDDTIGLFNPDFVSGGYSRSPNGAFGPNNFVWEYTAPNKSSFFAPIISGAQRLPNGNTLINEGTEGHLFEVTNDKRVVWDYVNPVNGAGAIHQGDPVPEATIVGIPGVKTTFIFRAYRYGTDYAGFQGHDLTPGDTLEINPEAHVTVGLFDPATTRFFLNNQVDGTINDLYAFNTAGRNSDFIAISGDWDGDGVTSVGLYDPTTNTWYLTNSNSTTTEYSMRFRTPGFSSSWIPVAGDWDHDGRDSIGLYEPGTDRWYLNNEVDGSTNNVITLDLPDVPSSWKPIVGDWDGDGDDTPGVYDPFGNNWYLNNALDGTANAVIKFHTPTVPASWRPITGDWDGDGDDSVGLYDPNTNTWYLNNRINGSISDLIVFRTPKVPTSWQPITGDWNGEPQSGASGEAAIANGGSARLLDVNADGLVTPLDAVLVINQLNASGKIDPAIGLQATFFGDVTGDMSVTPLDALLIINELNSQASSPTSAILDSTIDDIAPAVSASTQVEATAPEELAVIGHQQALLAALMQLQLSEDDKD
jgi:hypothetical protein